MTAKSNKPVFGGGCWIPRIFPELKTREDGEKVIKLLKAGGCTTIDTAQLYADGKSEEAIGELNPFDQGFTIDTKWISGWFNRPWASYDKIVSTAKESQQRLGSDSTKQIDIFYLHSPDIHTPFEETLKGVNEVYKSGTFKRFGISNFTPAQVEEVLEITSRNGWVKPTVYQGSYSAVSRRIEDQLFPLLRQHGFAFYAYSPIAGGFLTKTRKAMEDREGRFNQDTLKGEYDNIYRNETFMSALDDWAKIADEEGISKAELAFRWLNHHSLLKPDLGDAIIFGASRFSQVETTCEFLQKGPLKESSARKIDELWEKVRKDAFIDNFEAQFGGRGQSLGLGDGK